MKKALWISSALYVGIALSQEAPTQRCEHGRRGPVRSLDLKAVERRYREFAQDLRVHLGKVEHMAKELDQPYESHLPHCASANRRTQMLSNPLPNEWIGRRILVGPPDQFPRIEGSDILAATAVKHLRDVTSHPNIMLCDANLTQALGVRCWPSTLTIKNDHELEIHEDR